MKILFFTDTHIRGFNIKSRKDNFLETLKLKFDEVFNLAEENKVDYILHGGDFFDKPDVSVSIVSEFAELLNKCKIPIYTICGNHDVFGHNPDTMHRSMIGLLNSVDILNILEEGDIKFLEKNGIRVQLTGQPYTYDIDEERNISKYIVDQVEDKVDYSIHMVHGMLLDKPFIKEVPHTLIEDVAKKTKASITFSGHYHTGFGVKNIDDKYFINPGSLIRMSSAYEEVKRKPKVILLELTEKIDIKEIPLKTALPGKEVFKEDSIVSDRNKEEQLYEFKQSIESSVNFDKLDINDILLEIAITENIDESIKEEALKRISEAQMAGGDSY